MDSVPSPLVWVITGSSAGLGHELTLAILARGDRVVASARSNGTLLPLQKTYPETFSFLQLDIKDTFEAISAKAKQAVAVWGRVDVLVNNAGYSVIGTVEESRVEGFMEMFKTNVYGSINVTNAFLPYMRARRSGTVVFVGSRSGWRTTFPTNSIYGSSKAAIHSITETLTEELRPLNIRVLNVVPGGLRTKNIDHVHYISGDIPEYEHIHSGVRKYLDNTNGTQTGDPKKAAAVILDVVKGEGVARGRPWTGTLFLGSDAVRDVRAKCEATLKLLEDWSDVTISINADT
ncbi:hypothetical protein JB92DRAFT_2941491 [Gautieria morchelliformis]|nr:hypothetical protein JB92DRAFT_2941491 [Gautieria morchelliformis]